MKYYFTADSTDYVEEHDKFIANLLLNTSLTELSGIIYKGDLPRNCEEVKFSDYIALNGCVPVPEGFCGLFGTKSYVAVLRQFICETAEEREGTPYKINIDIDANSSNNREDNLSFYVDNLMLNK